jgi:HTH-type transcriptional regulator, quorum sensing regulator NprR
MIGRKIRQLRLERGLSQQQLAGQEMTRAFISLVESGKCRPSPDTLRIIARRLEKPVDYFTADSPPMEDRAALAFALLTGAEAELQPGAPLKRMRETRQKLEQVLTLVSGTDHRGLQGHACLLLGRVLRALAQYEEAQEQCITALGFFKDDKDTRRLTDTYKELGDLYYLTADFPKAVSAYKSAALYVSTSKRQQAIRAEVLTYLGTALNRLGEHAEAITCYRAALASTGGADQQEWWGQIAMGLGWSFFLAGNLAEARKWTLRSLEALQKAASANVPLARHNLAILEMRRGNWEQAYVVLQECLSTYRETGRIGKQASVLEDLAQYWQRKGDLVRAEQACWEAIDLLDTDENLVLRGRLYRMVGEIVRSRGEIRSAHGLLRVSLELLTRVKASKEADLTRLALQNLQQPREQA